MNEQEFIKRYLAGERYFSDADLEDICLDGSNPDLLEVLQTVNSKEKDSTPRVILQNLNLGGANLEGVNLDYINLENVNMTGADLRGADLTYINLNNVNLTESVFDCSNFSVFCIGWLYFFFFLN